MKYLGSMVSAVFYSLVYCLLISLPFILIGAVTMSFLGKEKLEKHGPMIASLSGALAAACVLGWVVYQVSLEPQWIGLLVLGGFALVIVAMGGTFAVTMLSLVAFQKYRRNYLG